MSKRLEPVWLWIKDNPNPLKVIGGILFLLALVAAGFWISGWEAEPTAFTLGMLSSLFLAAPSIAEYFMPNRKPVRHMDSDEIMAFILTTDPENDWKGVSRSLSSERFLKEDPRLRFRVTYDDDIQAKNFKADWVQCHRHPEATSYWYNLYYDGAFLERFILVAVDEGGASIPPPAHETKKIMKLDYHVAKIFDSENTVNEYIRRSGLEVED